MWMRYDLTKPTRQILQILNATLVAAVLCSAGGSAAAQPPAQPLEAEAPETALALGEELAVHFRLVPLSGSVGLMPLTPREDLRLIEVSAAGIAVDGQPRTAAEITALLGESADAVLRLAALGVEERAQVATHAPASPPPVSAPPVSTTEPPASPPPASPPPPPRRSSERGKVAYGDRVVIEAGESVEEAVSFGEKLIVRGEVEGDAIAFGDDVEISGTVFGSATAVGGDVTLEDGAQVFGDAVSIGGEIQRESGAIVHGREREVLVDFGNWPEGWWKGWGDWDWPQPHWRSPAGRFFGMMWDVGGGLLHIVLLSLVCCFILLVAPRRVEMAATAIRLEAWKAGLVGLASFLLFWTFVVLITLLLIASCVGVLLLPAVALLIFAFIIVSLVGYTAAAYRVGHLLQERFGIPFGNRYVATIAGIVAIQIWAILAGALDWGGWPLFLVALMFLFFGFLVELAAWMAGLGGFLMSRERRS